MHNCPEPATSEYLWVPGDECEIDVLDGWDPLEYSPVEYYLDLDDESRFPTDWEVTSAGTQNDVAIMLRR